MKSIPLDENLYAYILSHLKPNPLFDKVVEETKSRADAGMQISRDQADFMAMLINLCSAKLALEIGCFTGLSTLALAAALPKSGRLISIDIDSAAIKIAQNYAQEAGLADKIDFRNGAAVDVLTKLTLELGEQSVDFVFIDADKENLAHYYELTLGLLRPGGLMVVDNVLWSGRVLNSQDQSPSTLAIRKFNHDRKSDPRVEIVMLHIADGLLLLRKK
ncbi:MAG: class I SAM-dependent methyltransferase [Oligoflexales bacterium]|nr:class I SAM-dependent methyltransferase [Oligoflexales bacterium]